MIRRWWDWSQDFGAELWEMSGRKTTYRVVLALLFASSFITGWNNGNQNTDRDGADAELQLQIDLMADIIEAQNDLLIDMCRDTGTCPPQGPVE